MVSQFLLDKPRVLLNPLWRLDAIGVFFEASGSQIYHSHALRGNAALDALRQLMRS